MVFIFFDDSNDEVIGMYVQVSRISVVGLTYLAKSSLSVAVSRSIHDKYVRITKPHHSAKWLQHTSTVSGVICQNLIFGRFCLGRPILPGTASDGTIGTLLWISDPVRPCFLAITSSN